MFVSGYKYFILIKYMIIKRFFKLIELIYVKDEFIVIKDKLESSEKYIFLK